MEWVNLHTSTLDSPEVVGAEPRVRATWLFLLRYCCGQENGGVIRACGDWGDRKWQQLIRVTHREVHVESDLWRWEGADLRVNFYPLKKQAEVEAKRKAGKDTVAKRWQKHGSFDGSSADSSAIRSADTEGKGREEEGKDKLLTCLPESLQTPAMAEAWDRWLVHWSTSFHGGRPMPEQTAHMQLRELVGMGPDGAIAAINNSISKGTLKKPFPPFQARGADTLPERKVTIISAA